MKEIKRVTVSNIEFTFNDFVNRKTGELEPYFTMDFPESIIKKDANNDMEVETNRLQLEFSQLKAKMYQANAAVMRGFKDVKNHSVTREEAKDLLRTSTLTVICSRYEAGEVFENTVAGYWGISYSFEIEFHPDVVKKFVRTEEQRKADALARILA